MISIAPTREIAIAIGPLSIHWYGLLYLLAFLLAWWLLPRLQHYRNLKLTPETWSNIMTATVLGVVIGGRLGYVLFYNPAYFAANPLAIFAVWKGGMASHGGFTGVCIALWYSSWRYKIPFLALIDVVAVPAAIGLALGRLGNFINAELYGVATTVPWGMAVPGVEELRHPLAFYAIIKNLSIATICYFVLKLASKNPGSVMALFLLLYGCLRFLLEYVREQTHPLTTIMNIELTRGQLLTLPVLAVGVALISFSYWAARE